MAITAAEASQEAIDRRGPVPAIVQPAAVNSPAADNVLPAVFWSRRFVHRLAVGRQQSGTNSDHARGCDGGVRKELAPELGHGPPETASDDAP
jgi:hypothetical protein